MHTYKRVCAAHTIEYVLHTLLYAYIQESMSTRNSVCAMISCSKYTIGAHVWVFVFWMSFYFILRKRQWVMRATSACTLKHCYHYLRCRGKYTRALTFEFFFLTEVKDDEQRVYQGRACRDEHCVGKLRWGVFSLSFVPPLLRLHQGQLCDNQTLNNTICVLI
jgi:hypothetical protein